MTNTQVTAMRNFWADVTSAPKPQAAPKQQTTSRRLRATISVRAGYGGNLIETRRIWPAGKKQSLFATERAAENAAQRIANKLFAQNQNLSITCIIHDVPSDTEVTRIAL
jgi:hypothetical protein